MSVPNLLGLNQRPKFVDLTEDEEAYGFRPSTAV